MAWKKIFYLFFVLGFISLILSPALDVCGEVLDRLKQVGEDKLNDNKVKQAKTSPRESIKIGIGLPENLERKPFANKVWHKHLLENRKKWQDLCHSGKLVNPRLQKKMAACTFRILFTVGTLFTPYIYYFYGIFIQDFFQCYNALQCQVEIAA